jgi:hypothetical protein
MVERNEILCMLAREVRDQSHDAFTPEQRIRHGRHVDDVDAPRSTMLPLRTQLSAAGIRLPTGAKMIAESSSGEPG